MNFRQPSIATQEAFELLWSKTRIEVPTCEYCKVELTMDRLVNLSDPFQRAKVPSNLSPDRRVPGRSGGRYNEENLAISCLGCNYLKLAYTVDEATSLLRHLAETQSFEEDDLGFINATRTAVVVAPGPDDLRYIE